MRHNFLKTAVERIAVLAAVFAAGASLLVPAPLALAAPSPAKPSSQWSASISGLSGLVCVGDPYMLTVTWLPNPANQDPLAPLAGPKAVTVSAKQGSFDHETERPGTVSGTALFVYTAEKEGEEQVTVKVYDGDANVDASSSASFEVKKCAYHYELFADLTDDVQDGDVAVGFLLTYRAKGTLKAADANQPRRVEGRDKLIKFTLAYTYFLAPDCTVVTMEPGRGFGFIDARAEPTADGLGMNLIIGPPKDADWIVSNTVVCEGKPNSVMDSFPISSSQDPWIEKRFPFGEGTYPVNIDILDETTKNANAKGHVVSYKAILKLERVAEQ